MKFIIYLLTFLPLISCDEMSKLIKKGEPTMEDSYFISEVRECDVKIKDDGDQRNCLVTFLNHWGQSTRGKDPNCCKRVIRYKCMKKMLTYKCDVPEGEVEEYDQEHFNYWNDKGFINGTTNCNGTNSTQAQIYCHLNDVQWNIPTTITFAPFDFITRLKNFVKSFSQSVYYTQCYSELMNKTGILDSSDTHENKTGCCNRMVKFEC